MRKKCFELFIGAPVSQIVSYLRKMSRDSRPGIYIQSKNSPYLILLYSFKHPHSHSYLHYFINPEIEIDTIFF